MLSLIQRVTRASVSVDEVVVGAIDGGLLALVAMEPGDSEAQIARMAERLLGYRVLADDAGRMNRSLADTGGGLLLVSQFTLAADTRSGMRPSFTTAANAAEPELANQVIRPYSDLLLHDMGEGLADNRSEFKATGRDWRTPPLWGIGLTQTVSGHTQFLHDGRARNLLEAVLWHGGEAQAAQQHVLSFNAEQRAALLAFLNSL